MTHCLYRHFDRTGNLLYVGISKCAIRRTAEHHERSKWYGEIDIIKIERFGTKREAEEAEIKAIKTEKPKYNINCLVKSNPIKDKLFGVYYTSMVKIYIALTAEEALLFSEIAGDNSLNTNEYLEKLLLEL